MPEAGCNLRIFAERLVLSRSRCVVVGDSINYAAGNRMDQGYAEIFRPTGGWSGWTCNGGPNGNTAAYVDSVPSTNTAVTGGGMVGFGAVIVGTGDGGDTSQTGENNVHTTVFYDSGKFNVNPAAFTLFFDGDFLTNGTTPPLGRSYFYKGDPLTASTSRCRLAMYAGAARIPSCGFAAYRGGGGGTQTHFEDAIALSAGYNQRDLALSADTRDILWQINATNSGAPDETNKNIYLLMARLYNTAGVGLEMSFAAKGGATVAHHIDTTRVSDAAITNHVSVCEVDTVIIWLGQNDLTIDATWAANVQTLVNRWANAIIAAGRVPRILLVTSYVAAGTDATKVQAMASIHQSIAAASSYVSHLPLGLILGTLPTSWLADTVHPSATGKTELAKVMWDLLERALTVPTLVLFPARRIAI